MGGRFEAAEQGQRGGFSIMPLLAQEGDMPHLPPRPRRPFSIQMKTCARNAQQFRQPTTPGDPFHVLPQEIHHDGR